MSNQYEVDYEIIFTGTAHVEAEDVSDAASLVCVMDESINVIKSAAPETTVKRVIKREG
jgi:hypothetical protein